MCTKNNPFLSITQWQWVIYDMVVITFIQEVNISFLLIKSDMKLTIKSKYKEKVRLAITLNTSLTSGFGPPSFCYDNFR